MKLERAILGQQAANPHDELSRTAIELIRRFEGYGSASPEVDRSSTAALGVEQEPPSSVGNTSRVIDIRRNAPETGATDAKDQLTPNPTFVAASRAARASGNMLSLASLGAMGLLLFLGGFYWTFDLAPQIGLRGGSSMGVGWLLGIAGMWIFCSAADRWFEQSGADTGSLLI